MSKYKITLEVESDRELAELIKGSWGALIIGANHPWKIIDAEKVNA
jgi:hypothetical protein